MTHSIPTADLALELAAPSPTVLDIYVVWHPKDQCGRDVFDKLVDHYHSEHFSGLAGSAIEIFSRSYPRNANCDAPAPIPTRCGTVDTTPDGEQAPQSKLTDQHSVPLHRYHSGHWPSYDQSLAGWRQRMARVLEESLHAARHCIFSRHTWCPCLPDYWGERPRHFRSTHEKASWLPGARHRRRSLRCR